MQDVTVKAYARAFAVLTGALAAKGSRLSIPDLIDKCSASPVDGLTPIYLQAIREHALGRKEDELIRTFLADVDPDDELHNKRPLPQSQQGVWLLEYEHWREYMTTSEAAAKLGISPQRVGQLIKDGRLEAVKVGNTHYISSLSVDLRS